MTNYEIIKLLRNDKKDKAQMLKEIVEKRIIETSKEKFNIQEIYYYSKYFGISTSNLLLNVLEVKTEDYKKIVKGHIRQINSETYNQLRNKYIQKQKQKLKYRVNWNKKTYYNKEKLIKDAEKYNINVKDFGIKILEKSVNSTYRILKDNTNKKRLFIGQYINTFLPKRYIEENIKIITNISKAAINKVCYKFGIKLQKEDYKEEVQKCIIFISYHGNNLKKNNQPTIITDIYRSWHGKMFYYIALYYEMKEIKKIKREKDYDDKIRYKEKIETEEEDVFKLIEELNINQIQRKILKKIYAGYKKEEIIGQENISEDQYTENLKEIKKQIQSNIKVSNNI